MCACVRVCVRVCDDCMSVGCHSGTGGSRIPVPPKSLETSKYSPVSYSVQGEIKESDWLMCTRYIFSSELEAVYVCTIQLIV